MKPPHSAIYSQRLKVVRESLRFFQGRTEPIGREKIAKGGWLDHVTFGSFALLFLDRGSKSTAIWCFVVVLISTLFLVVEVG